MRRTILSALALVLAFAFAAEAKAAESRIPGGTYTTLVRDNDGIKVERVAFEQSGNFSLTTTDADRVVSRMSGTYVIEGETLVLRTGGKEVRLTIVSQDDKLLVLRAGTTELRYARVD
jgi:hypothetical protein